MDTLIHILFVYKESMIANIYGCCRIMPAAPKYLIPNKLGIINKNIHK